jgi:hypothetical protein
MNPHIKKGTTVSQYHRDSVEALKKRSKDFSYELAYIAGPYTARHPDGSYNNELMEARIRIMSKCMGKLMSFGVIPTSPLLMHLVRMHTKDLPGDWSTWEKYSKITMDKCDYMIVLEIDGYMESTGVNAEREHMQLSGKNIYFLKPEELLAEESA